MWPANVLLLALAGPGLAQMVPLGSCAPTTTQPSCTLKFTPFMAPQIRPTSTVYKAIVTQSLNIIDCRYCTVEQVDKNPPAIGSFTTVVTKDVLMVTRVGCMAETTASTRGHIRGYSSTEEPRQMATNAVTTRKRSVHSVGRDLFARDSLSPFALSADELVDRIAENIDPSDPDLRQQAAVYARQVRTAQLAVDIVYSGFDLDILCQQSRTADVRYRWAEQDYDAVRLSNIICFADAVGFAFGVSYAQLKSQFSATLSALQDLSQADANITQVCQQISLDFAKPLEIDSTGIKAYICSNGKSTSAAAIPPPPMVTAVSGTAFSVGTITSFATGAIGPWANSTIWSWQSGVSGTGSSFATATGVVWPLANSTGGENSTGGTGFSSSGNSNSSGASWSIGWGSNATGLSGTGSEGGSWGSGGSWATATVTGGNWNSSGGAASATGTAGASWATSVWWTGGVSGGWHTGGSWTVTGSNANGTAGFGTGQLPTATVEGSATSWTVIDGTSFVGTGWGGNATAVSGATSGAFATGWGTGGLWTAEATGWGFNQTNLWGSATGIGNWSNGASWTATGHSWGTGVGIVTPNITSNWGTGAATTLAVTGAASGAFSIVISNGSVVLQNATWLPLNPTGALGYPTWTTSTVSGSLRKRP